MGGAYLRSRIKQAGKWDQETIVSFFLCQYCSGEYLLLQELAAEPLVVHLEIDATVEDEPEVAALAWLKTWENRL
ncbi:hypothetical protein KAM345_032370 [Aeromonas caviae]|nr:hypothetical protein KAM345_032370 [Aeromonas caviae]